MDSSNILQLVCLSPRKSSSTGGDLGIKMWRITQSRKLAEFVSLARRFSNVKGLAVSSELEQKFLKLHYSKFSWE